MLAILRSACPFPNIDSEGELRDGLNIAQPKRCHRCASKSCRQEIGRAGTERLAHRICEFGYSLIHIRTRYGPLLINGVVVPFQNTKMDAPTRKANRSQKVPWEKATAYAKLLDVGESHIQDEIGRKVKEAVAGIHDIKTAVNVVFRNAEALIAGLPGYTDADRIDGAAPSLKALLKSVNLLNSRLNLASIVANPEAASYGQPRRTPVYKLFHLMVRLFEEEAARRSVRVKMAGQSFNSAMLHDSFETIPLVLLDNAVKYATPGSEIVVRVNDSGAAAQPCVASVESIGPLISAEHQSAIFERGFRAPQAKEIASSGSGLGLYIAQIVAVANKCTIEYQGKAFRDGAEGGANVFTVRVGSL